MVSQSDYPDQIQQEYGQPARLSDRHHSVEYNHNDRRWDGDSFFIRIRIAADYDRTEDQSGLKLEQETEFFLNMDGPLQSSLNGLFGGSQTYWNGQYFEEQFNQLSLSFAPSVNLRVGGTIRIEDVVDFANIRHSTLSRYSNKLRISPPSCYTATS